MLVIIGKGNKQRAVPAPRRVLDELHRYGMPSHGPLFPWQDGRTGPVVSHAVSKVCNNHLHRLGIPESLHKLRHFYGTAMYAASKDVVMVQRMLGHTSVAATAGYVAYDQQAAHTAAETVSSRPEEPRPTRLRLVAEAPPIPEVPAGLGGVTGRGDLSARELEVLHLVAAGASNRAIGASLGVSEDTVKSHLRRIGAKLGANGRAGLVAVAMRAGLVA